MVRYVAFMAALAVAGIVPQAATAPVFAQDAPTECASAYWLESPATDTDADDATPAVITEPAPDWLKTELTDACTGKMFALTDFAGKTIYIETMATWCPPCRDQLRRVKEAAAQIPEEERQEIVFVALSSEVDLPRETLAEYAESNDFPFIFAVMSAEMLRAMVEDLGQEIAVPPATPHVIVAPDGTVGEVHTGSISAEELLALLAETEEAAT